MAARNAPSRSVFPSSQAALVVQLTAIDLDSTFLFNAEIPNAALIPTPTTATPPATSAPIFCALKPEEGGAEGGGSAEEGGFARERAAALEPKVPMITIRPTHPSPSMEIILALDRLGADKIGAAIPVDPGGYEIIARAPSLRELRWTITVKEGARLVIDLPELVPQDGPPYPAGPGEAARSRLCTSSSRSFVSRQSRQQR